MSRGIGALQRRILDHLAKGGRWPCVYELAGDLHFEHHPADDVFPHACYVSTVRAVKALAKRGAVHCDTVSSDLRGKETLSLACWLPGQAAPTYRHPLMGVIHPPRRRWKAA